MSFHGHEKNVGDEGEKKVIQEVPEYEQTDELDDDDDDHRCE